MLNRIFKITMPKNREWLFLLLILGIALGLRMLEWSRYDILSKDEIFYVQYAMNWDQMPRLVAENADDPELVQMSKTPFFPFVMSCGLRWKLSPECTGMLISLTAGLAMVFFGYKIGTFFGRTEYGLLLAFLIAVNPYFIEYSVQIMRDQVYWSLLACCIYLAMKELQKKSAAAGPALLRGLLCGVVVALAMLFRREGVELLFLVLVADLYSLRLGDEPFRRRAAAALSHGSGTVLCAAGIVGGWFYYLASHGYLIDGLTGVYLQR